MQYHTSCAISPLVICLYVRMHILSVISTVLTFRVYFITVLNRTHINFYEHLLKVPEMFTYILEKD